MEYCCADLVRKKNEHLAHHNYCCRCSSAYVIISRYTSFACRREAAAAAKKYLCGILLPDGDMHDKKEKAT